MTSALERLTGADKPLVAEPPDNAEIAGLLRSARARLADAGNNALSIESRFDLAFDPELSEGEFAHDLEALRRAQLSISQLETVTCDVYDRLDSQLSLFGVEEGWDQTELVGWLDRNIAFPYADRDQKSAWINAVVNWLVTKRTPPFTVAELAYRKFRLRGAVERKLAAGLREAKQREFEQLLRDESRLETRDEHSIVLRQGVYAYDTAYTGLIPLRLHFFPVVGNLKPKGEEFECAEFIANMLESVAWWVRNVDRKPSSFSLQTSSDRFYPDFLIGLENGSTMAVEYKGGHIAESRDSIEKKQIGELWEKRSKGCAFAWVENRNWPAIRDAVARCRVD